ncbi:hypothetical protein [Serinibacter salmoneus]|uniref:Putative ribosomally synthesized peptide with SipW-like signal peptide n=1 Tax=Serinibacter salmoneus TaxID=556530 RepID=A0A2A9CZD8_9MICO|nr:hypothetical protein [Serinibacter salmoneus]PFG19052.1 putative ribosomally synthesized peptide with SipW-like signal peptide [Serinibacter salmoneus]
MTRRSTATAVTAATFAVGTIVGLGGTTFALWSDRAVAPGATFTWAQESFAAGIAGESLTFAPSDADPRTRSVPQPGGEVTVTLDGPSLANDVLDHGAAVRVLQTSSLSEGSMGLRYTAFLGEIEPDSVLGQAQVSLFATEGPDQCHTETPVPSPNPLTSTPVSPAPGDRAPVVEYWCLQAVAERPQEQTQTGSPGVLATDETGNPVEVTADPWNLDVVASPHDQGDAVVTFSYTTFRSGT